MLELPVQSTLSYRPTPCELASPLLQSSLQRQAAAAMSRAPLARMLAVARDSARRLGLDGFLKAPSLAEGVWGWVSFSLAVADFT
ncbi:hypothetical protein [Helicobacter macacae]|uniref:hypothetical protein n=1 Tax=Helicobacter macacae TaxID=398626 RepID=UPI0011DCCDF4|nr:hypothetical protein [Helicobacter macacae]